MSEMGGLAKQTPILACFFVAASLATIGLPGFGNFWGEFGVFLSLGEHPTNRIFLVLAALGIIISAIFGLRAVARIFFGPASDELQTVEKKNPLHDLNLTEIIPASAILIALLWIGLWPRTISPRIDAEIQQRYQSAEKIASRNSILPCCPINDSNGSKSISLQPLD